MFRNETAHFLERLSNRRWNFSLSNIQALVQRMDNPHEKSICIHVAGTNGKGSTCAMIESIFRAAGYKTGLFTSPHLVSVLERIRINRQPVTSAEFENMLTLFRPEIEEIGCTYFEALTAVAFRVFAEHKVDLAIVETGLGGRLDATNIITKPVLSIITNIDFDHELYLGNSLGAIAQEKAGIIKKNQPCLTSCTQPEVLAIIEGTCRDLGSALYQLDDISRIVQSSFHEKGLELSVTVLSEKFDQLKVNLAGRVQARNAMLAIAATKLVSGQFPVSRPEIYRGLADIEWAGRMQVIGHKPKIVLDVGHNPAGISAFLNEIISTFEYEHLLVVIGLLADKNYREIAKIVESVADSIFVVTPESDRALPAATLASCIADKGQRIEILDNLQGFGEKVLAKSRKNDLICVMGSHYVVGSFLKYYDKKIPKILTNRI